MDTFLFAAGHDAPTVIASARGRLERAFPGQSWVVREMGRPDMAALLAMGDAEAGLATRIGEAQNDGWTAVAYGELDHPRSGGLAQALIESGPDGLADVYGCFGGLLVDRSSGAVHLVGDGHGQRCMAHARVDGTWLASPHDLALVAAGVPPELSLTSFGALLRMGWSFGGHSLIEGVHSLRPEQIATFRDGRVTTRLHPGFDRARELRAAGQEVRAVRDSAMDDLVAYVRDFHRPGVPLQVELSAGFDSRAVLAVALEAARPDVETFTDGPPTSQDVRVAAWVAKAVGVFHRPGGVRTADYARRVQVFDGIAASTNGQATAMPLMTNALVDLSEAPDTLGGDGAEVFRGVYYPRLLRESRFDAAKIADAVMDKFTVGRELVPQELDRRIHDRVRARFEAMADICTLESDAWDFVHLLERTGVWNQKLRRVPSRRSNPFYSRRATWSFLTLPGVRGHVCGVHEHLLQRYAPSTTWIPFNGETIPALLLRGELVRKFSDAMTLAAKAGWKIAGRFVEGRAGTGRGDLEEIRSQNFREHLDREWRDLLVERGSVLRETIGIAGAQSLVDRASGGDMKAADVLASVVVTERFFRMARDLAS